MEYFSLLAGFSQKRSESGPPGSENDNDAKTLSTKAFLHIERAAYDMHFAALPLVTLRFEVTYTYFPLAIHARHATTSRPLLTLSPLPPRQAASKASTSASACTI